MRLAGKVAAVIGAGQTPGGTIGNGRATAILLAREGARVMLDDTDPEIRELAQTELGELEERGFAQDTVVEVCHTDIALDQAPHDLRRDGEYPLAAVLERHLQGVEFFL